MTYLKRYLAAPAAAIALLGLAGTAHAQVVLIDEDRGPYAGVGVDTLEFDAYTLSARGGYSFNQYFALEGQGGFGISEEDDSIDGFDIGAGIDWYAAGFAVGKVPVTPQVDLLGRAGYYFAEVDGDITNTVSNLTTDVDADVDGFAFGAGAQFKFGDGNRNAIRAEYTYLDTQEINDIDVDDLDAGGDLWSVSFIRKF